MGSKYLDRAPSGLRIVILSKGSCKFLSVSILTDEQTSQEELLVLLVGSAIVVVVCKRCEVEEGRRERAS